MTILSDTSIREKINSGEIGVEPFQSDNLQPSSLDLTLGHDLRVPKNGVVTKIPYETSDIDGWFDNVTVQDEFKLNPGQFVIGQIQEKITLPNDIMGNIHNRSSLIRLGIDVGLSSYINPGYSGKLPIAIRNVGPFIVPLVPGIRICQLVLFHTSTPSRGYDHARDAKYQNEENITLSRLSEDEEIAGYLKTTYDTKSQSSLANYLNNRIAERAQHTIASLTLEQKTLIGLHL